jgi:hypothetical protein
MKNILICTKLSLVLTGDLSRPSDDLAFAYSELYSSFTQLGDIK